MSSLASTPFTIHQAHGPARTATLTTPSGELATPNAFYYTKKGNPAHLTPDLLAQLQEVRAFHLPIAEFTSVPGEQAIQRFTNRIHDYLRLPNHILYFTPRDPLVDGLGTSNENGVSLIGTQGTTRLSPAQYAKLCSAYQPDIITSISDEVSSTMASNRCRKSSQRSVMWLDEMQQTMSAARSKEENGQPAKKPLFFAAIQGGSDIEQRKTSCYQYGLRIAAASKSTDPCRAIDGFVVGGLGSGEDAAKREEILTAVVSSLPSEKPRVLSSSSAFSGAPDQVLKAVAQGIDLFEVQYPHQLTLLGQASVFKLEGFEQQTADAAGIPTTKLHLRDSRYARDQTPILEGCQCFTCKNHTRAYLHHLLNVHEMLAPILLDLHNLHHYSRFLSAIRTHLSSSDSSRFTTFAQQFMTHFAPSASTITVSEPPKYHNQVGRALLGPFAPILVSSGPYVIRRILPKDNQQVASIIRTVLTSYGYTGKGFAYHDNDIDEMYQSYETHNLPPPPPPTYTHPDDMQDVPSTNVTVAPPADALPPLRSAYFVVALSSDDNVILGGGGIAPLTGSDGTIGELRKFYFLPDIRRQGLGQKVIELCVAEARKFGYKKLYLETTSDMGEACSLYLKNGFKRVEEALGNTGHSEACGLRFLLDL